MRALLSIFVLLAVICTVLVSVDALTCKYGEEYKCSHELCENRCFNKDTYQNCTLPCTNGCYCKEGFARVAYNRCKPDFYCGYKDII
ncbi:chymotrypsin-elastase inhibitor ixodidin-like [Anopheles albimanus]|uniref:TIL domain-containing protein n=1 Tax=Anopheles albimanus TaxID=7167 RepID=A0A182FFK6_ANOAL|nr:chymotrypsin-elastase inhibitor ixodidin-like [Anopheles albimanus]